MRYHTTEPEQYDILHGRVYACDHPCYNFCTLFEENGRGLAVIQQHFEPVIKYTHWGQIDPWLHDILYEHPGFREFFEERAGEAKNGVYPTVTVRQLMWALRMKPLKKEVWETAFDRKEI